MKYYPVFLDVKARPCLIVGGGPVGVRKARALEKCGAKVTLVSEYVDTACRDLERRGIRIEEKMYEKADTKEMFLVFAATNNALLNQQVQADAGAAGALCNVADAADQSDFILPSTVDRGDLILAVSTSGASPAMAKKIREELFDQFGPEYADMLGLMRAVRKKLLASGHTPDDHRKSFHALIEKGILKQIENNDIPAVNRTLKEVLGNGYEYEKLVFPRSNR